MLRAFMPEKGTVEVVDAATGLPERAVWVDMLDPSREEENVVEAAFGLDVPTREEMQEIEHSSRFYRADGVLYMTATILAGADTEEPVGTPITFILARDRMITVRYADTKAFTTFTASATFRPATCNTGPVALLCLLEAVVDRLADVLERVGADLDDISKELFQRSPQARNQDLTSTFDQVVRRIGFSHERTSKTRESLASLIRLLSFLQLPNDLPDRTAMDDRLDNLNRDIRSLTDYAAYLSGNVTFLLDASLGMINVEQNGIIKIFSVMAVIFLPPTLVASIYGMNFALMPELQWPLGYPFALALMVAAAVLPYLFFKRRGWL